MTSSFYSLHDTKTPVKVAALAMLTNIVFSIILMRFMMHSGLAFANSIASFLNLTLLSFLLRKRLGRIDGKRIMISLIRTSISSFIMAIAGWFIIRSDIWKASGMEVIKSFYLGGTIILCLLIYILLCLALKSEEIGYIYNMVLKKGQRQA